LYQAKKIIIDQTLETPKRNARAVTVFVPQKGCSKPNGGIPLDDPVRRTRFR
jgi:hypothetical protein